MVYITVQLPPQKESSRVWLQSLQHSNSEIAGFLLRPPCVTVCRVNHGEILLKLKSILSIKVWWCLVVLHNITASKICWFGRSKGLVIPQ